METLEVEDIEDMSIEQWSILWYFLSCK